MVYRLTSFLFICLAVEAATVPGRFIVELSTEPVATHALSSTVGRANLQSAESVSHRARIQREQALARTSLEAGGATILDQVDTVANALLVQVTAENPTPWSNLKGILQVRPVHTVDMLLDRAVVVNKIANAWAQIGGSSNAGRGMKVGIIDSGVDVSHPGFQNSPLSLPANYPLVNNASDVAFTNNKVIVARSYVSLLPNSDPDLSARDRVGHGTALAMIAAGGTVAAPAATLTGIAPAAWIGNYKVFGTPNANDGASDDAILKALDDAVKDGMDVVNLSLGSDITQRLGDDIDVQGVERATQAGVLVVVAAGNNGTNAWTVSSPGTAPDAITVGGQRNDRTFSASVQTSGLNALLAIPGSGPNTSNALTAVLADVTEQDSTGLACGALPPGSFTNKVAVILRGSCTFATKITNAANAGAAAALIYAAADSPDPIAMDVGTTTLPAEMISNADGIALKQAIAAGTASVATLTFTLRPVTVDAARVVDFSAAGPNVDYSVKPDLVAVAQDYYTATQSYDPNGDMYDPSRYILVDGTSFSTPTVAGAAALLKSARPGLTAAQYRSLLINSASPIKFGQAVAGVQQAGTGSLNAGAALLATAAAYPTSLSFGAGGAFPQGTINLQVSNVGTAADTFYINVVPTGTSPAPVVSTQSLQLAAGASDTVAVTLSGSNLAPGGYEGFVVIGSANGQVDMRVPYWYGVTSATPVQITDLDSLTSAPRRSTQQDAITFNITDSAGVPITSIMPTASVIAGGGAIVSVTNLDADYPGLFSVTVQMGRLAGTNTFRVQAGSLTQDFTIVGQ